MNDSQGCASDSHLKISIIRQIARDSRDSQGCCNQYLIDYIYLPFKLLEILNLEILNCLDWQNTSSLLSMVSSVVLFISLQSKYIGRCFIWQSGCKSHQSA